MQKLCRNVQMGGWNPKHLYYLLPALEVDNLLPLKFSAIACLISSSYFNFKHSQFFISML